MLAFFAGLAFGICIGALLVAIVAIEVIRWLGNADKAP